MMRYVVALVMVLAAGCVEAERDTTYPPMDPSELDHPTCEDPHYLAGVPCCSGFYDLTQDINGWSCTVVVCDFGHGYEVGVSVPAESGVSNSAGPQAEACADVGPSPCIDGPHGVGPWPFTEAIINSDATVSGGSILCD